MWKLYLIVLFLLRDGLLQGFAFAPTNLEKKRKIKPSNVLLHNLIKIEKCNYRFGIEINPWYINPRES